jgi:hypothetical protein
MHNLHVVHGTLTGVCFELFIIFLLAFERSKRGPPAFVSFER